MAFLSFVYKTEINSKVDTITYDNASRSYLDHDPFGDKPMDFQIWKLNQAIEEVAATHKMTINFKFKDECLILNTKPEYSYFDEETGLEMNIDEFIHDNTSSRINAHYRNQKIKTNRYYDLLKFDININTGKASEILHLDRNTIKDEYDDKLFKDILACSFRYIKKNYNDMVEREKEIASMYLQSFKHSRKKDILKSCINADNYTDWEKIRFDSNDTTVTAKKIIEETNTLIFTKKEYNLGDSFVENHNFKDGIFEITSTTTSAIPPLLKQLSHKLIFKLKHVKVEHETDNSSIKKITLSKGDNYTLDINLIKVLKHFKSSSSSRSRLIIPCNDEYSKLQLSYEHQGIKADRYNIFYNFYIPFPYMLSPYNLHHIDYGKREFQLQNLAKVIDWVYENRFDPNTTKEQICEAYELFMSKYTLEELNDNTIK